LLAMSRPCKAINTSLDAVFDTPFVRKLNSDYKEFFTWLASVTGLKTILDNGIRNMWSVWDTLFCEVCYCLAKYMLCA